MISRSGLALEKMCQPCLASRSPQTITKSVTCAPICGPQPAPPVPMNDGPDQPCWVRATTTPSPAFPLIIKPAFTTLMMASPRAFRRMRDGMPFSGMCRNSLIVLADRFTVSCSVAFAPVSDKEKIVRMKNSFFIAVHLLRCLSCVDVSFR